jgi:hypothetical protein
MAQLLTVLFNFLSSPVFSDVSQFIDKTELNENGFRLLDILEVIEWFVDNLQCFDAGHLPILRTLFSKCAQQKQPVDYHCAAISKLYSFYDIHNFDHELLEIYQAIFQQIELLPITALAPASLRFLSLLLKSDLSVWAELSEQPQFMKVFRSLFTSDDARWQTPIHILRDRFSESCKSSESIRRLIFGLFETIPESLAASHFAPLLVEVFEQRPEFFVSHLVEFLFAVISLTPAAVNQVVPFFSLMPLATENAEGVNCESLCIRYAEVVAALCGHRDEIFHGPVLEWLKFWSRSSETIHSQVWAEFWACFTRLAEKEAIALDWVAIEAACDEGKFMETVAAVRLYSAAMLSPLFEYFVAHVENTKIVDFVKEATVECLFEETVMTAASEKFYRLGVQALDADLAVMLYSVLASEITTGESEAEKVMLAKLAMVALVRRDLEDSFAEIFPLADRSLMFAEGVWVK